MQFVYSVFDKKVAAYGTPFFAPSDGAAVRSVQDAARDPSTTLSRHAEDFALFKVGSWGDGEGVLDGQPPLVDH